MFGNNPLPPKPPRYEPLVMFLIAALVAALLTLAYFGVMYLVEQANQ